ncbi:MAG: MBL fold metallo-hydrolase [Nannocystaceae bacterium]
MPGIHRVLATLLAANLALTWGLGCAASTSDSVQTPDPTLDGSWQRLAADPRIGRYTSSGWGFSTASYWIEGPTGLVLVDLQFLPSATRELVAIAERETGKKVVLAIVLHANPDKFNGTQTLQERGIKVVTSQQVVDLIPAVHQKRVHSFYERYKPDYPQVQPAPESFGATATTLEAGGISLQLHPVGGGCSAAHVLLTFEGHLFAGDLLASGVHSWLELGLAREWLVRVEEMQALAPTFVHPGRGSSGGPELLTNQRAYLNFVLATMAGENPRGKPEPKALARVKQKIVARYPEYGFSVFLEIGLPAVWRELAAATKLSAGS